MKRKDIHKLIEGYFDATLSLEDETLLKWMIAHTDEDSDDIREAQAVLGIFATDRKLNGIKKKQQPRTVWAKVQYAAVLAIIVLLDVFFDLDDNINNDLTK